MLNAFARLDTKSKLSVMEALNLIRTNNEFTAFLDFLSDVENELTRNLRILPLDQIQKEQGKSQQIADLIQLIDQATAIEVRKLKDSFIYNK